MTDFTLYIPTEPEERIAALERVINRHIRLKVARQPRYSIGMHQTAAGIEPAVIYRLNINTHDPRSTILLLSIAPYVKRGW